MSTDKFGPGPSERITAAFAKLTESAKSINDISGELAKPIASLERALQRLNPGVACWTEVTGHLRTDRRSFGLSMMLRVTCASRRSTSCPI